MSLSALGSRPAGDTSHHGSANSHGSTTITTTSDTGSNGSSIGHRKGHTAPTQPQSTTCRDLFARDDNTMFTSVTPIPPPQRKGAPMFALSWNDPGGSDATDTTQCIRSGGVPIPSLLQSFFDLEYIPYLIPPPPHENDDIPREVSPSPPTGRSASTSKHSVGSDNNTPLPSAAGSGIRNRDYYWNDNHDYPNHDNDDENFEDDMDDEESGGNNDHDPNNIQTLQTNSLSLESSSDGGELRLSSSSQSVGRGRLRLKIRNAFRRRNEASSPGHGGDDDNDINNIDRDRRRRRTMSDEGPSLANTTNTISDLLVRESNTNGRVKNHNRKGILPALSPWTNPRKSKYSEGNSARIAHDDEILIQALRSHHEDIKTVIIESVETRNRASIITTRVSTLEGEITALQQKLHETFGRLNQELAQLHEIRLRLTVIEQKTLETLQSLEQSIQLVLQQRSETLSNNSENGSRDSSISLPPKIPVDYSRERAFSSEDSRALSTIAPNPQMDTLLGSTCVRPRAHSEPRSSNARPLSYGFIRIHDLDMAIPSCQSSSSTSSSEVTVKRDYFFCLSDHDVPLVVESLFRLGFQVATDESQSFEPGRDTKRIIEKNRSLTQQPLADWPIHPWHVCSNKDIYIWNGSVPHKGPGHNWPVIKARALVQATPRVLLDFLMDSSQIKKYNKVCLRREEVDVLQKGVDTLAQHSAYGIAGDIRIFRTLNKPKLLPKIVEVLSMWYTKPLEASPGSYMTVYRSVWEDDSGRHKASDEERMIRSEMLLGVTLLRKTPSGDCEMTTIAHAFSPGVPEILAKRIAPSTAMTMLRDIQAVFAK